MIIILIIYLLIIGYIILKAFYTTFTSIKLSNNNQQIEKFRDSINYISMPFYINMSKIYLLCIFVNIILISFIFLPNLMNDLILLIYNSNITYCQDVDYIRNSNESSRINLNKIIEETYGIFSRNMPIFYKLKYFNLDQPYICHLNHFNIEINNHIKVFQGLSQNIEDILNKQNCLLQKILASSITLKDFKLICKNIMERDINTLDLISRAYDHTMFSYNTKHYSDELFFKIFNDKTENKPDINRIIRGFINDHQNQVENLNKKTTTCFIALEKMCSISEENYFILDRIIDKPPIDNSKGNPWLYQEYRKQIDIFYKNWNGNQILDNNIPIISVLNLPEEIEIKNYDELCNYSSKKINNNFELRGKPIRENYNKDHSFFYIKKNIDDFHRNMFIKKTPFFSRYIENSGFVFKDISSYYDGRNT